MNTPLYCFGCLTLGSLVATIFFFVKIITSAGLVQQENNPTLKPLLVKTHRRMANLFLFSLVMMVLSIRGFIWVRGSLWGDPTLFGLHLAIAIPLVLLACSMRWIWNGLRAKTIHRRLSYYVIAFSIWVVCSGAILAFQIP